MPMNFYKADKSQMEACSRVLKSAFAGYPFLKSIRENRRTNRNFLSA